MIKFFLDNKPIYESPKLPVIQKSSFTLAPSLIKIFSLGAKPKKFAEITKFFDLDKEKNSDRFIIHDKKY